MSRVEREGVVDVIGVEDAAGAADASGAVDASGADDDGEGVDATGGEAKADAVPVGTSSVPDDARSTDA